MATRADDLEPAVTPVAKRLKEEYGELKRVLSASVLAFDWLPVDYQKIFMARAGGAEVPMPAPPEDCIRDYLERMIELSQMLSSKTGRAPVARRAAGRQS